MTESTRLDAFNSSDESRLRNPSRCRVGIGHALVDNCSSKEACEAIITHAKNCGSPAFVITPNAQHIVILAKDRRLRKIYDRADLVVPDGASLLMAARLYGRSLQERVTGVDLFQALCKMAARERLKVFLLGGRPSSAQRTEELLKRSFPDLQVDTYCPPFHFEQSTEGLQKVNETIRAACPDILFVALGAPKQEYWIHEHGLKLSVPVCIGVGGTFEIVCGIVPRAPAWIQSLGCEWLYRLCREPRRMWRRYLIGNIEFSIIVLSQLIRRFFLELLLTLAAKGGFAAELNELSAPCEEGLLRALAAAASRNMGKSADSLTA